MGRLTTAESRARTTGAPAAIGLHELVVRFDRFTLGPVSLAVGRGELFCLVGPNGSGKTTMLRTLLGLQAPDEGSARLAGESTRGRPPAVLARLGFVSDDGAEMIPELTAEELWEFHAYAHARASHDPPRVEDLVARAVEVARSFDFVAPDVAIEAFSHGMRRKTQIAAALLHDPDVVVLDEPHDGLDPIATRELDRTLDTLVSAGKGVLLATHDLHYAERAADRVGILYDGRLLAVGSPAELAGADGSFVEAFFRLTEEAQR